jgi:hypothetical protein
MILLCNFHSAKNRMDFFGMSLTANKIFSMFQSAFSISTMYKWIKEEEI